jgi:hypothetical protein
MSAFELLMRKGLAIPATEGEIFLVVDCVK